ncbi:MAG: hypothetical protein K2L41_01070 [Muribaculaceae bacterium]|nr:hypothetical protein [Muribaculaceae bacterium]
MIKHLLLFGASMMPCAVLAADFFITPEGNGSKDGSTWENAMGLSEYYAHMKFVFNTTPVNESHQGEAYYFSTGNYTFNQTVFIYRSGVSLKGGYDPSTGELAESGRTVFDGNNQVRNNGALFIYNNTEIDASNVNERAVYINGIDFENFITKGEWRANETNWQSGRPGAVFVQFCGRFEVTDCNFRNNVCQGTGNNAMAGALSLNKVNALIRNCSFVGNEGTDGGAVKMYYNQDGNWSKMSNLVVDCCYFSGNKATERGGAIYARNAQVLNILNSTIVNNESKMGGGVFANEPGGYSQIVNVVSSTVAGNKSTDGAQIYTNGKGVLNVANSIVVADGDEAAIADATETTGYAFQGNNLIGGVAEGYTASESDDINAGNNYQAVFDSNVLAENGTLTPIKFKAGMAVDAIRSVVAAESWNYSVDCGVDQLGKARAAGTGNGALAVTNVSSGVDDVTVDSEECADESWYNLQGMRFNDRPTAKGVYIHKGQKVLVL